MNDLTHDDIMATLDAHAAAPRTFGAADAATLPFPVPAWLLPWVPMIQELLTKYGQPLVVAGLHTLHDKVLATMHAGFARMMLVQMIDGLIQAAGG